MLPAVPKFLGRVFAHREQECPSAKGSVSREVKKARKTGFQWPRIVLLGSSFALFSGCFLHVFMLPVLACTRVAIALSILIFSFSTYDVLALAIFFALESR